MSLFKKKEKAEQPSCCCGGEIKTVEANPVLVEGKLNIKVLGAGCKKGTAQEIFHNPCHPYTIGLMKSKPVVGQKVEELYNIPGSVPNPVAMPNYCYFRDRCEMRCDQCDGKYPPEIRISDTHVVSCYRHMNDGEVLGYPKSVNVEEL